MPELLLIIVSGMVTVNYLVFLSRIYTGLNRSAKSEVLPESVKYQVSVIIPFRNEAGILDECIMSMLGQDYPEDKTEFIFIDDNSTDGSSAVFEKYKDSRIRLIRVNDGAEGKKHAIEAAVKVAVGEIILSTDADCTHSREWIRKMAASFDHDTGFVAGLVKFEEGKTLLNRVQDTEFASLMITAAGLIRAGEPIICSAANIAYRKDAFNAVGGLSDNIHLKSGDDEFLMRKINRAGYKVSLCHDPETIVFTKPASNLREFLRQRQRWASKGLHYESGSLILKLILIFLFYFLILLLPVLSILTGDINLLTAAAVMYLIKIAAESVVLNKGKNIYPLKAGAGLILFTEILHVPYIVFSSLSGALGNYRWKDRTIKR